MRCREMRMRRGVRIMSEKSSAYTDTGDDGRAAPAASAPGMVGAAGGGLGAFN